MDKQAIRKMAIAPLVLLAAMLGYPQGASADGPTHGIANQRRDGRHLQQVELVSVEACRTACATEARCRSWVHVREWVETRQPLCKLSSEVGRPHYDTCCVSGIKPPPPAVKAGRDRQPRNFEGMAEGQPPPPEVKR